LDLSMDSPFSVAKIITQPQGSRNYDRIADPG